MVYLLRCLYAVLYFILFLIYFNRLCNNWWDKGLEWTESANYLLLQNVPYSFSAIFPQTVLQSNYELNRSVKLKVRVQYLGTVLLFSKFNSTVEGICISYQLLYSFLKKYKNCRIRRDLNPRPSTITVECRYYQLYHLTATLQEFNTSC